jgi:hypothetical protein
LAAVTTVTAHEAPAAGGEAVHRPARQAEQAQLLGRRRIDGQPVRVVGVALGVDDLLGLAVPPDGRLPQEPVGRPPGRQQEGRGPPPEAEQDEGLAHPGDHRHEALGDEPHRDRQRRARNPEVEVPGQGEVVDELRALEVGHARRGGGRRQQAVVQRPRQGVAQVHAHLGQEGRRDLHEQERGRHHRERDGEVATFLDRPHDDAHDDHEDRRQGPAQHEQRPPGRAQATAGQRE